MAAATRGNNEARALNPEQMEQRRFAGVFDLRVGTSDSHSYGSFGYEYISGSSAVGWWEFYQDSQTGVVYKVHCWDGMDGGKDAHTDQDNAWLTKCYRTITERCRAESQTGQTVILLSRNEWVIMASLAHQGWLDLEPGEKYARQRKAEEGLDDGFIGMCGGVPVVCDQTAEDRLPPRE